MGSRKALCVWAAPLRCCRVHGDGLSPTSLIACVVRWYSDNPNAACQHWLPATAPPPVQVPHPRPCAPVPRTGVVQLALRELAHTQQLVLLVACDHLSRGRPFRRPAALVQPCPPTSPLPLLPCPLPPPASYPRPLPRATSSTRTCSMRLSASCRPAGWSWTARGGRRGATGWTTSPRRWGEGGAGAADIAAVRAGHL